MNPLSHIKNSVESNIVGSTKKSAEGKKGNEEKLEIIGKTN